MYKYLETKMKNIEKINPFIVNHKKTSLGLLTILQTKFGISTKGGITVDNNILLSNYIYDKDNLYNVVYTVIDTDGNVQSFCENEGILPTLFLNPYNSIFVSIQPYDPNNPNRDFEITIPLFNRENTDIPKQNRPFVGEFIGIYKHFSLLHDSWSNSWDENKPDKLQFIEFKNEKIKKKHNKKIPLPQDNTVYISNDEIHLLTHTKTGWLHRTIEEKATILKERLIDVGKDSFWQILKLSFEDNSYILCQKNGQLIIKEISSTNNIKDIYLIDFQDIFYSIWKPIEISENTFVTNFTTEFGNGWFTIKDNELIEFFYEENKKGYKNLLTNEVLEMDVEDLIISGIYKTTLNSYAVVFYHRTNREDENKELLILNRQNVC